MSLHARQCVRKYCSRRAIFDRLDGEDEVDGPRPLQHWLLPACSQAAAGKCRQVQAASSAHQCPSVPTNHQQPSATITIHQQPSSSPSPPVNCRRLRFLFVILQATFLPSSAIAGSTGSLVSLSSFLSSTLPPSTCFPSSALTSLVECTRSGVGKPSDIWSKETYTPTTLLPSFPSFKRCLIKSNLFH